MAFTVSLLAIILHLSIASSAYGDLQSTNIAQSLYDSIIGGLRRVLNIFLNNDSTNTDIMRYDSLKTTPRRHGGNIRHFTSPQTLGTLPYKVRRQGWSGQEFVPGAPQRYPGQLRQHQDMGGPREEKDPRIERILNDYRDMLNGPGSNVFHPPPRNSGGFQERNPPHPPFYKSLDSYVRPDIRVRARVRESTGGVARGGKKDDDNHRPDRTRPDNNEPDEPDTTPLVQTTEGRSTNAGDKEKDRFTTKTTTTRRRRRTTPERISLTEDCDYLAYYCLKAYDTGIVCGRTMYFVTHTFQNYCMLDYVNCMERYDIWQVAHMGECFNVTIFSEYKHYPYNDDYFLDQYYIVEDM